MEVLTHVITQCAGYFSSISNFTVRVFPTSCSRVILFDYADVSERHGVTWLLIFDTLQCTSHATAAACHQSASHVIIHRGMSACMSNYQP